MVFHSKLVQKLLEEKKQFWPYDILGEDYGKYLRYKMVLATGVMKTMMTLAVCVASLMNLSPLIDNAKKVPLECYIPEFKHSVPVVFLMESISLAEILYLVGATDALYVLMCTEIKIQFLLLQKKLTTIRVDQKTENECINDLKICVIHHNLLLR